MSAYVLESFDREAARQLLIGNGLIPFRHILRNGQKVLIDWLDSKNREDMEDCMKMLNQEIEEGTYPQDRILNEEGFESYFLSHAAFVLKSEETSRALGCFYIKPNFPGRCRHICNGGFLVRAESRSRLGVGRIMADAFERFAPVLGFKAAFFNLVFCDNEASLSLWRSQGYRETGRVPSAKYIKHGDASIPVDAIMFYKSF
ncbi:MAG: GNAT family N-acetyltransferase [Oligoflexales bacterium]|nr:GNAT family N-acetyltransferase [Oligoflexales bacterium]